MSAAVEIPTAVAGRPIDIPRPPGPKQHSATYYWAIRIVSLLIVIGGWQVAGSNMNPIFLSTPARIVVAFFAILGNGQLFQALQFSVLGLILGFGLAIIVGVPMGIVMGRSRSVATALEPYVDALYVTPRVALIPLLLIWFGIGFEAQVVVIFLSSVFPIIINSQAGVREISNGLVDTARAFCASERDLFIEVILPASVPFIMTGLRLGIGQSVIGMIVAQMFLALTGLGKLLVNYGDQFKTDYVFAVVIVVGTLGVLLTEGVKLVERRFVHWKDSERAFA